MYTFTPPQLPICFLCALYYCSNILWEYKHVGYFWELRLHYVFLCERVLYVRNRHFTIARKVEYPIRLGCYTGTFYNILPISSKCMQIHIVFGCLYISFSGKTWENSILHPLFTGRWISIFKILLDGKRLGFPIISFAKFS